MRLSWEKLLFYLIGLSILTLGIAFTILSRLGTSPFDALLVGLFRTFGLTIGSWEIIVGVVLVICNSIALRRRPQYLALLTAFITGLGIDFWMFVLQDWVQPAELLGQSLCLGAGLILSALGIATYLQANFAPIPMDGSMLAIRDLTGMNVALSRTIVNVILILFAFFFNGAIGVGTVLNMVLSGPMIHYFMQVLERLQHYFASRKECVS